MKRDMRTSESQATLLGMSLILLAQAVWATPGAAQEIGPTEQTALSVAHAALKAISNEDPIGLTDLMIDGATILAMPTGGGKPRLTTRDQARARPMTSDFVERGFDGQVQVIGDLATVWLPYDFYRDGEWSHCGVDLFTLVRVEHEWLIASLAYTVEQPPTCSPHPDGAPGG